MKSTRAKAAAWVALAVTGLCGQAHAAAEASRIDRDLMEVDVATLERYYSSHRYTVRQVVEWHLARIHRYDGIYRAIETVMERKALADAAREDAVLRDGRAALRGPLFGVPIVIKANTSIEGEVTTNGWEGFTVKGKELVAPRDALIVAKLCAAGAIIIGHANMPDFANSDTNRSSSFGRTGNAYDVRFSPGGSSGGVVTAITSNMAVLGNGTDTANSIRMPSGTSAVVGVFPTRGLVSIAGIAPLDWLLDNTGPIARNVTDATIALDVMAGTDPLDRATANAAANAQSGPYTRFLRADALKGRRFAVPAFMLKGGNTPFHGIPAAVADAAAARLTVASAVPLHPDTREAFMKAIDELRAAGAEVIIDDSILAEPFLALASRVSTYPYVKQGADLFLRNFGPAAYRSSADYLSVMGRPLGAPMIGDEPAYARIGDVVVSQADVDTSADARANYFEPRRRLLAAYLEELDRRHLDGFVYPAIQMPPVDETMPQDGRVTEGPHSATGWVNMIGVPAVVVVGGFYPSGLPFGLEISARPWKDGDLLGYAYAYEQATHHRHPPVLVEQGLLPDAR